jgi:hypothetical protein
VRRPSFLAVGRVAPLLLQPRKEEARRCCWRPGLVAHHAFERGEIISGRLLRTCDAIPWALWGELWAALFRSAPGYPWPISPAPNRSCSPA